MPFGDEGGCPLILAYQLLEVFKELFFWCVIFNERDDHFVSAITIHLFIDFVNGGAIITISKKKDR